MIAGDDLRAVRDDLARLESFCRTYAEKFAAAWVHDLADRIGDVRRRVREVDATPRCTSPGCSNEIRPTGKRGPRPRYCSPRCRKRASRAE